MAIMYACNLLLATNKGPASGQQTALTKRECGSPGLFILRHIFGINMHVKSHVQCPTAYYYSNKCIYEKTGFSGFHLLQS
jgi:hypothetical protein